MKKSLFVLAISLFLSSFKVSAQNSPIFIWGDGLNGIAYQQAAIFSESPAGLVFGAPLNSSGARLPITFGWRGGGSALKILPNGNVGIGTDNPKSTVDVLGQISSYLVSIGQQDLITSTKNFVNLSTNNHGSMLLSSNLYISGDDNLKIANTHTTMAGAAILMPGNLRPNQGSIIFYTNPVSPVNVDAPFTGTAAMLIKSNGNVGIGTSNTDDFKLAVNGTIRAKEIKVEANWADFVFEEGYKLRSLEEVAAYIKTNKHLPDIPSEKEVSENGIHIGEMNAKLLQKIEELTIYMIDMKNENDKLKAEIKEIKQLMKK